MMSYRLISLPPPRTGAAHQHARLRYAPPGMLMCLLAHVGHLIKLRCLIYVLSTRFISVCDFCPTMGAGSSRVDK